MNRIKTFYFAATICGPTAWKRHGAIAAALVLVAGLGGFAVWAAHINGLDAVIPFYPPGFQQMAEAADANAEPGTPDVDIPEIADIARPDIAEVPAGAAALPSAPTLGGYEVVYGSGPSAAVTHYVLPYIEYGDVSGVEVCLDWDVPMGAVKKDLTQDEIVDLMGGAAAVSDHLDWGGYQLSGWAAWYEDGSFWGAFIHGVLIYCGGPADQFEFAVTANQLPPTCFGYPDSVTQEIRGLTVTADKYDWEWKPDGFPSYIPGTIRERRVSFMKDDCGYRFEMSSASPEAAEEMVSRLVARIADKGLDTDALTSDGAVPAHLWEAGSGDSVGEPNWNDSGT